MSYPETFVQYCHKLALKLTSLRKEVLYHLWCSKKPLKAYEILEHIIKTSPNIKPASLYRVLDFFVANGMVHKIESIQSYTVCCEPEKQLASEILMVCNVCHQVIEVYDANLHELIGQLSENHHFKLSREAIEIKGICKGCLK